MEDYPAPSQLSRIHPVKVPNTSQLLKEFNNVLDSVELTHLTPPQTPPQGFVDNAKVCIRNLFIHFVNFNVCLTITIYYYYFTE